LLLFSNEQWLRGHWTIWFTSYTISHSSFVHTIAIGVNFVIHWGTIVGTMTAITAGLVSFVTVPLVITLTTFRRHWKEGGTNGT